VAWPQSGTVREVADRLSLSVGLVAKVFEMAVNEGEDMAVTESELCCDVCGTSGNIQVAGSGLGPASFGYCEECIARDAEPLEMIAAAIFTAGGLEVADFEELADISTFDDGQYRDLKYVIDLYPAMEGSIREAFFGD
jgi:hypothetical protein